MTRPTVSVIIPCYNYGRFLQDAVDSVLQQTFQDFEIIVVDDHSTDNTPDEAAKFTSNERIKYVRQPHNVGQSQNRNTGINLAQGEFITFLDADDAYEKDMLEKLLLVLEDHRFGVSYCLSAIYDAQLQNVLSYPSLDRVKTGNVVKDLYIGNFIPGMTLMTRLNLVKKIGGFHDEKQSFGLGVDWWFLLQLATQVEFQGIPEYLCKYRHHSTQMSNNVIKRISSDEVIRIRFMKTYPNLIDNRTHFLAKRQHALTSGYYYRKNHNIIKSLLSYLKYTVMTPFSSLGYKSILCTLTQKDTNTKH